VTIDRSRSPLAAASMARLRALFMPCLVVAVGMLATHAADAAVVVPKAFSAYGSTPVPGGECIAGDTTKEGMNGHAYVYVKDTGSQRPRWITAIPVPEHYYQNRATHCFAMNGSLYVLVQSDTSQATSLSQTVLNVVELSPDTGTILTDRYADVPGVEEAYSSWVEKGSEGFHENRGQIEVSGKYFMMNDSTKPMPFTVTLPPHSTP